MKFIGRGTSLALAMLAGVATAACYGDKTSPTAPTTGDTTKVACKQACPQGSVDTSRYAPLNDPWANPTLLDTQLGGVTSASYGYGVLAVRKDAKVQWRTVSSSGFASQAGSTSIPFSGTGTGLLFAAPGNLLGSQYGQLSCGVINTTNGNLSGAQIQTPNGEDARGCLVGKDTTKVIIVTKTSVFACARSTSVCKQLVIGAYDLHAAAISPNGAMIALLGMENDNNPGLIDTAGARFSLPFSGTSGFTPTDPQIQIAVGDSILASVGGNRAWLYRLDVGVKRMALLSKPGLGTGVTGTSVAISPSNRLVLIGTSNGSREYFDPYYVQANGTLSALTWSQAPPDGQTGVATVISFFVDNDHAGSVFANGKASFEIRQAVLP